MRSPLRSERDTGARSLRGRLAAGSRALLALLAFLALLAPLALSCAERARRPPLSPERSISLGIEPTGRPNPLVLISIDGFRWDYLDLHHAPTLSRMARDGVRARELVPVFPTKTFPNHYTLVTGLYPEHHGIVTNTMIDPTDGARFALSDRSAVGDARWWGGEPIWVTAHRAGLRTATLFWPGSEAPVRGVRPSEWAVYDGDLPVDARIDRALEWLGRPADQAPSLVTLYFEGVDDAGHEFGPASPQVAGAVLEVDRALERLLNGLHDLGLEERVNVVVVSDHGMTELSPERLIVLEDLIDLDEVEVVAASTFAMLRPPRGRERAVLELLRDAHPRLRVYARDEVPARLHYRDHPRITPIVAIADEGWYVRQRPGKVPAGMHGFDPALRSMHGLFVAAGPAFRSGLMIDVVHSVDVYELMCAALGLVPAPNDGNAQRIRPLLEASPNW